MKAKRIFDGRIKALKKIEQDQEATEKRSGALEKKRRDLLKTLWDSPIRLTEITKEVAELVRKAEKNPIAKLLLNAYRISLKDVALAVVSDEKYIGKNWDCPANNSWNSIFHWHNDWFLRLRYLYGSPKDQVKLIFRRSGNESHYFCGFVIGSPMKMKCCGHKVW